ncbi:MAG: hypothetical protein IT536_06495 [Hyphomicrobiales bacterium]|nr:hypothetical protein [Hyphomicrobiales bacterium]
MSRSILTIAAVALAMGATPSAAQAGGLCCCPAPCLAPGPPVMVYEPYRMPQIYVVDQGPVYSGPGIYTNPTVVLPRPMPPYPYVGRDDPYGDRYLPPYVDPLRARGQALRTRAAR